MPTGDGERLSTPGRTTLLMYACSQGDLVQVKHILHAQPKSATHRDRTLKTALHYCAGGGGEQNSGGLAHCADLLVMAAPGLVETRDEDGFTPLHLAVISGNMQLVTFLLANGADVNSLDSEKHSVVHWATVCGETAALGAVISAGSHVSTPDVHGGFPLHYAAQMCGSEKDQLGLQVLHILLAQPGISISVEDNDGRQPLLWAASAGSARAILALVRAGAAVEAPDRDGLTALHCAASRGHTDCLDTLLTLCGATPDVIDSNGCTALHYSVTLGHADATALLLSHGADPNRQDRKGRSPAHCGCAKGQLETVKQLGTHNANLWLRNARGDLPLHEAAASGRRQLVRWLLDQRPSQVNARNNDGRCPLHLAALNDNADMCKILLDAGAQVNPVLRTSKNVFMTPLDCALQRGFRSTAKFLQLHGGIPASRLSSVRVGSDQSPSITAAANIHIRDDVTVKGSSSSESELEEVHKKGTKPRRRSVRRRVAQRNDKKRGQSGSGSEADVDTHVHTKRDKSTAIVKNIDDKTSDREKIARKHDKENGVKAKAARDVDVLRQDGDGRTVKQIELKSNGQQFRKKRLGIRSISETDQSSPSSQVESNGNFTKAPNDKSIQCKPKTRSAASQKENFLDAERQKQDCEHHGENISDTEAMTKKRESTLENGDIPSKKSATEESQQMAKKISIENGDAVGTKEALQELGIDKQEDDVGKDNADSTEQNEETKKVDTSIDAEGTNPVSEVKVKKESSVGEGKSARSQSRKESVDVPSKLQSLNSEEGRKRLKKQQSMYEEPADDVGESSNGEKSKKRSSKSDSANSTKRNGKTASSKSRKDSPKSTNDKTEIDNTNSEKVEVVLPKQENDQIAREDTESSNQPEDETELSKKVSQPDQLSLQSKMSEESPSKTIVVEAAVHQPPKGVEGEDTTAEPLEQPVDEPQDIRLSEESNKEVESQLAPEDKSEVVEELNKEVSQGKIAGEESPENDEDRKDDEDLSEEEKVTTEETKTQPTVISVDDSTTATEIKSQEALLSTGDTVPGQTNQDNEVDAEQGVEAETNKEQGDKLSTETKSNHLQEAGEKVSKSAEVPGEDGAMQEEQIKVLRSRAETLDKTEELPEDTEDVSKEEEGVSGDTPSSQQIKNDDMKAKPTELNIDLSLKKFEETADLQDGAIVDAEEKDTTETTQNSNQTIEEVKQKKYRKKKSSKSKNGKADDTQTSEDIKTHPAIISELPVHIKHEEKVRANSSTSRESSSSESDSEKSVRRLKSQEGKKGEHKSFKILKDDVAFEVLKDGANGKEPRKIKRKSSKKNLKEVERPNESATSSPEMLESSRTRSKSLTRESRTNGDMQGISLPVLSESKLRPESNLSAPNLSSVYSDNEHKSASNSEVDDIVSSASRKRRFKKRAKLRIGSKSAGSDYESSNLIDSGFEPSPRSSRIPRRKVMSERGVNMTSVTQTIQSNIRKYQMERKIFQHLLDLKRLQIRSGQANEALLVKRAIDNYHNSVAASVGAGRYLKKDYSYRSFEQFLYQSLRMLQKSPMDHMKGLPETPPGHPLHCTQSTHRCLHATHAYTGIPCAAYIPKMNHHTIPKIGFTPRSTAGFLPQINSKAKSVTLELCHGNDKQVISLPADRLDHNKRYYVTFTVKGQEAQSPTDQNATSHRHAKSV